MSLSIYKQNISQLTKQVAELQAQASQKSNKKAQLLGQVASIRRSITSNPNPKLISSKETQIAQIYSKISAIENSEANISKKLFGKRCELTRNEETLAEEIERQSKKEQNEERRLSIDRKRQNAEEIRQLKALNSELERQNELKKLEIKDEFAASEVREIIELISKPESQHLEFKSYARWDIKQNCENKALEKNIVKTVAAFLNSEGGTLLIGVADDGQILGLENDYLTAKNKDRDSYELLLHDLLLTSNFGHHFISFISITFHQVESKEICRIIVKPSKETAYVKNGQASELYIRTGNSSRQLDAKQAIEYSKNRWGGVEDKNPYHEESNHS
ncbi:putative transcriptional regulator with HTH domain [Cylindrospermum stagnale PCC 7417]|uniref:Putative transcriptional regulator with HTH domain n=1 Tax=Cylindrospermum stagnale PCC 7417 TaxID=56107 RepID=K9X0Z6_9NOST|nr:RNA-binding domain-containing protein [Cylindrospermum stagnale]AFZ25716.1 putative transcriptional regulator with HTH domain [Cylindrospermum stagnale PCC 7417]